MPAAVWQKEWVVHTQPVGSGEKALGYLAAYVTALSSQRIVKEENGPPASGSGATSQPRSNTGPATPAP